jgi:hypothetical protein
MLALTQSSTDEEKVLPPFHMDMILSEQAATVPNYQFFLYTIIVNQRIALCLE